jgi:hypothetical protein
MKPGARISAESLRRDSLDGSLSRTPKEYELMVLHVG